MQNCLNGFRVLDLSRVLAGPYCTMQLADLGAEVIKIEHPDGGDQTRSWGPPFNAQTNTAAYFEAVNRNKKSVALNLAVARGAQLAAQLVKRADVVVENFMPQTAAKLKLDYRATSKINPRIIHCSITGYGLSGPWQDRPGYDFIIQGESGLMALGGTPNGKAAKTGVAVCDVFAGLNAAQSILAALLRRARTGKGAHIDISLLDCAVAAMVNVAQASLLTGTPAKRHGNHHPHIVPYGAFNAKDGDFNLAVGGDRQFATLCDILGKPRWAQNDNFRTNPQRVKNRAKLIRMLNAEFARRPAAHWLKQCLARGVPAGRMLNIAQTLNLPQIKNRGMWSKIPGMSSPVLNTPLQFAGEAKPAPRYPPALGAHSTQVLRSLLKLTAGEIRALQADGVLPASAQ